MPTDRIARVGWSTGLKLTTSVGRFELLASSGEIREQREPVYVTTADVGNLPDAVNDGTSADRWWEDPEVYADNEDPHAERMKIITADGNVRREISIAFSCDNVTLPGLLDFVFTKRKEAFSAMIGLSDLRYVNVDGCVWSQLTLSGSANGLVTGSLSLQTTNVASLDELEWNGTTGGSGTGFSDLSTRSQQPYVADYTTGLVPYWQTGNNDVVSWSVTMSQALTPVYINDGSEGPAYFRVGNRDITTTLETLVDPQDPQETEGARNVKLCAQRLFKPLSGLRLERVTTKGQNEDPVKYSFTFGLHAEPTSYDEDAVKKTTFEIDTA